MTQQIYCPHCHQGVSSLAAQCPYCGTALSNPSWGDRLMEQAPPTHPGSYDVLDLEDRDQTMVSKGPRHAEEFEMPEEENYPTLQMGGLAASELRD